MQHKIYNTFPKTQEQLLAASKHLLIRSMASYQQHPTVVKGAPNLIRLFCFRPQVSTFTTKAEVAFLKGVESQLKLFHVALPMEKDSFRAKSSVLFDGSYL